MEQLELFPSERKRLRPHGEARAVVVLSGGQDSTTCLFWALDAGFTVYCLTIDYGQRHRRELEAARKVFEMAVKTYGPERVREHEVLTLGSILKGTSPLVSDATLEQYKDHQSLPGGLEKTFVPMRNQLFLTLAANRAAVWECEALITGVAQEDYGGYPDCRRVFVDAVQRACNTGTFTGENGAPQSLAILTPLMYQSKAETVNLALTLHGCYAALAFSHTAYDGAYPPVGHDHATLLRAKGFEEAGVPDPLVLRAAKEGVMALPSTPNYSADKVEVYGPLLWGD